MKCEFPPDFFWGTSTAAAQVETAHSHQWKGLVAEDGAVFDRTTDHELRRQEDVAHISYLAGVYRCSVDWSRLQAAPTAAFDPEVVVEYQQFFQQLREQGVRIMFVVYHFAHPVWFEQLGGWTVEDNIRYMVDFTWQCLQHFGSYVWNWNTINEPNVYATGAYFGQGFPPHKNSFFLTRKVLRHLSRAHDAMYHTIKSSYPEHQVGISLNTACFSGLNLTGRLRARFSRYWFIDKTAQYFENVDFWGLSYYAHILFNPAMITPLSHPALMKRKGWAHDKMWVYHPEGIAPIIRHIYKRYGQPIIITENGICTDDPEQRIASIKDYLGILHRLIQEGIPIKGYIHWSTWDNFEWHHGPSFRFGLFRVDPTTKDRSLTTAGRFYHTITRQNWVEI